MVQRAAGLGERFLEEAVEAFIKIEKHPARYARVRYRTKREIRRYLLAHFPYAVIYEVRKAECLVVAIAHAARRPGYWATRIA